MLRKLNMKIVDKLASSDMYHWPNMRSLGLCNLMDKLELCRAHTHCICCVALYSIMRLLVDDLYLHTMLCCAHEQKAQGVQFTGVANKNAVLWRSWALPNDSKHNANFWRFRQLCCACADRQTDGQNWLLYPLLCMRTWDYKASLVLLYSTCITAYHAMTDLKFGSCTALSSSSLWLKHRNCHYQGQESQTPSPWLRHRHCVHWRPFTICAITVCSYWHAGDMISVSFQIATRDLTRDAFTTSPVAA